MKELFDLFLYHSYNAQESYEAYINFLKLATEAETPGNANYFRVQAESLRSEYVRHSTAADAYFNSHKMALQRLADGLETESSNDQKKQ